MNFLRSKEALFHCLLFFFFFRAFDTLAKALNTTDGTTAHNLADGMDPTGGGNIHVISRDQSTPIIEVEGPLLTDTHVTFKVCASLNVLLNKLMLKMYELPHNFLSCIVNLHSLPVVMSYLVQFFFDNFLSHY